MNYIDFSTRIKKKYPQYGDMDDRDLAQRIVAKYPQYDVSFEEEATAQETQPGIYRPPQVYLPKDASRLTYTDPGISESIEPTEIKPARVTAKTPFKGLSESVAQSTAALTQVAASSLAGDVQGASDDMDENQRAIYDKGKQLVESNKKKLTNDEKIYKQYYQSRENAKKIQDYTNEQSRFLTNVAEQLRGEDKERQHELEDARYFLKKPEALLPQNWGKTLASAASVAAESGVQNVSALLPGAGSAIMVGTEQGSWIAEAKKAGLDDTEIVNQFSRAYGVASGVIERLGDEILMAPIKAVLKGRATSKVSSKILSKAVSKEAKKAIYKKILPKLLGGVNGLLIGAISEGLEEFTQDEISDLMLYAAFTQASEKHPEKAEHYLKLREEVDLSPLSKKRIEAAYYGAVAGGFTRGTTQTIAKGYDLTSRAAGKIGEKINQRKEGAFDVQIPKEEGEVVSERDNIRNVSEKEAAKTQHVPQREVEEGDTKKEPDRIYKEIPPSQPVLKSVVEKTEAERKKVTDAETSLQQKQADTVTDYLEKTKPEDVPPSGKPQTLADKGITEQQFFELPDEERHKVFRDLSEEEQDYLLQWDGETEREIAETIDRIKRSAEEQKEIDKIETEPSEAQKEAGNYPKAHIKRDGLDISIENAAGSERSGKDETGKEWKQTINHDYGYVKGTKGPDKDHVDVFIKPGSSEGGTVYVVNQVNPNTQKFDEPKCMIGFESEAEAKEAYLSNYEENWQGLGSITPMSVDVFKKWVYSKDAKKKSPVTVADLKKYEQVKPEPKKESTAKKTETIQKEGFEQPSPEYSEDVIPKEDVPVIQIRKDEDKKPQQKMPGQGRKDMENRLGNIIGYSIIVADEKELKESGIKEPLSQRDKRRERSYEDGKAVAKKLIEEIEGRNYAELVDRLSVLKNKGSRAAFTAYTGIKLPKTVSGTKSVIRTFVGKDVYNKHLESIKKKKEEAAQKQKQKAIEERNERLKEEKVTDNGRLTNNFDLIHRLVEDEGYTRLEEEKKGIATHYLIHNDEKERYYRFRKKDHGDLIKELLEKQFGEVEITPPGVRVATKKDLDHLFGKDLKPEEKEKGTNKPADQNVISLKQEEFNAKENTKENQADTKAIKETGRSVRTVTSTRGGSHPRRQAAVKRSQPDESYSVEYWQAQHLHNLNVSLYNALRFGWKDRKGKSHPGMQPGWINDFNILTDSNILGGRRGKNLSSNAQSYLQDLVDSFNESPEYLAELA